MPGGPPCACGAAGPAASLSGALPRASGPHLATQRPGPHPGRVPEAACVTCPCPASSPLRDAGRACQPGHSPRSHLMVWAGTPRAWVEALTCDPALAVACLTSGSPACHGVQSGLPRQADTLSHCTLPVAFLGADTSQVALLPEGRHSPPPARPGASLLCPWLLSYCPVPARPLPGRRRGQEQQWQCAGVWTGRGVQLPPVGVREEGQRLSQQWRRLRWRLMFIPKAVGARGGPGSAWLPCRGGGSADPQEGVGHCQDPGGGRSVSAFLHRRAL